MPTTKLSEHFTLEEMTVSQNAARAGISNIPAGQELENLGILAKRMELVRSLLGNVPITVSSGYRSPEVNKLAGGATNSAHLSGLACDFIAPGFGDPLAICHKLEEHKDELQYDQLIHEFASWVHIGFTRGDPRLMALTIDNGGTRSGFA
jgi:zinc D-Ala-D-Ala carboxypeptidase